MQFANFFCNKGFTVIVRCGIHSSIPATTSINFSPSGAFVPRAWGCFIMNCKHLLKSRFLALALVCTPLVPQASAEMISLNDALYEALESNLTLRINAYQTFLREQDVESARATFDPTLFGSINTNHQEQDWTQSESDRSSVSLGLSKRLQSGTSLSLQSNYLMNFIRQHRRTRTSTEGICIMTVHFPTHNKRGKNQSRGIFLPRGTTFLTIVLTVLVDYIDLRANPGYFGGQF